jgi:hypothetical protein
MRPKDIQLHGIRYTHSRHFTSLPSTGDGKLQSAPIRHRWCDRYNSEPLSHIRPPSHFTPLIPALCCQEVFSEVDDVWNTFGPILVRKHIFLQPNYLYSIQTCIFHFLKYCFNTLRTLEAMPSLTDKYWITKYVHHYTHDPCNAHFRTHASI